MTTGFGSKRDHGLRGVHTKDLASVRPQDLRGYLAKKSQADHAHELAKPGVGLPDALHGDRSERGKGGGVQTHCLGHFDDQVLRHGNDACVRGVATSTARHPVAGLEPSLGIHGGEDRAGGAVAQFLECFELGAHSLQRLGESVLPEAVEHLPDEIWPLPGLAQK